MLTVLGLKVRAIRKPYVTPGEHTHSKQLAGFWGLVCTLNDTRVHVSQHEGACVRPASRNTIKGISHIRYIQRKLQNASDRKLNPSASSEPPIPACPRRTLRISVPIIAHPTISTSLVTVPTRPRPPLLPLAKAREQHDEHAQEQEDHGRKTGPHAHRVKGMRAFILAVDVVFDSLLWLISVSRAKENKRQSYPEKTEINRHHHHRQHPSYERDQGP